MFKDFRKLKVWNHSRYLLLFVFQVTEKVLDQENSILIRNMQKSCLEILINIEKAFSYYQTDDFHKYLNHSVIAVKQLERHLHTAKKMQLFENSYTDQLLKKTIEVKRLLISLIREINKNRLIVINSAVSRLQELICPIL
jgi:four helix bundle protein